MKIVIRSPHHAPELAALVERVLNTAPVVVEDAHACSAALADADILFCQPSQITPGIVEAIGRSDRLQWIQVLGSGTEKLKSLENTGRIITNAADAYGSAVAEHAVALALALVRRIPELMAAKAERRWGKSEFDDLLDSLEGARAAVIGFGAIGREIARRLQAFGTDVVAVRRRQGEPAPEGFGHIRFLPLDEALDNVDFVFLAVPLSADTRGLIDQARLAKLARGARLINVSRGDVVDAEALMAALASGALSGAALDVFSTEPLEPDSPLWTVPNLIVSPHVAGRGNRQVTRRMIELCARNLKAFVAKDLHSSQG